MIRRTSPLVLAVLLALSSFVPAAADTRTELQESRSELREAQRELDRVEASVGDGKRRVAVLDARLTDATERLLALEGELERKRGRLAEAEAALAEAERQLDHAEAATAAAVAEAEGATRRLEATEDELTSERATLGGQAANVYKHGGPAGYGDLLTAVLRFESPSDAALGVHLVESAISQQKATIERIDVLRVEADVHRRAMEEARQRRMVEEAAARTARSDVADLTDRRRAAADEVATVVREQRGLVRSIRVDQEEQRRLLVRLERRRQGTAQLIDLLEAESVQLEAELRAQAARERASGRSAGAQGTGTFVWPTSGPVTSGYGYRTHPVTGSRRLHAGIDIGAPTGQTIVAADRGTVIHAGWRGGYGNTVIVSHGGGLTTLYAHQSGFAVRDGESVARGEAVGYVGSTGMSTGPHLHFEVRVNGSPRDPLDYY